MPDEHFFRGVWHDLRKGPVMTSTSFGQDKKRPETGSEQGFLRAVFSRRQSISGIFNAPLTACGSATSAHLLQSAGNRFYGTSI
jgi:hypothetical protein